MARFHALMKNQVMKKERREPSENILSVIFVCGCFLKPIAPIGRARVCPPGLPKGMVGRSPGLSGRGRRAKRTGVDGVAFCRVSGAWRAGERSFSRPSSLPEELWWLFCASRSGKQLSSTPAGGGFSLPTGLLQRIS